MLFRSVPKVQKGILQRKESITIYSILLENNSKAIKSFLYCLHNRDYRMRKRAYVYLTNFLQTITDYSQVPADLMLKIINESLKEETVTKLQLLLPRLRLRVIRAIYVPKVLAGKNILKSIDFESFSSLYLKLDDSDTPPMELFSEEHYKAIIQGLYNSNIKIKLVCVRTLRRLYNESEEIKVKEEIRIELEKVKKWLYQNQYHLGKELDYELESLLVNPQEEGDQFLP